MNFNDATLTAKVTAFTSMFSTHTELIRYGQFYLTGRLTDDLINEITSILRSDPILAFLPAERDGAIAFFNDKLRKPIQDIDVGAILTMIDLARLPAAIGAMFTPGASMTARVKSLYNTIWDNNAIASAPPWLGGSPSFPLIQAAYAYEKDKCFQTLQSLARKLSAKRGVTSLPATAKISNGNIAGLPPQGSAPTPGVDVVPQQTIKYNNLPALAANYKTMRAAIDAQGVVQCGVLSGASHEHAIFPKPEHYVMAFAYGKLGTADVFLFWDPDSNKSNITGPIWGKGIGCLFALPDRLSTAADVSDLKKLEFRQSQVRTFGDHLADPVRHCYQVYYLQTLPA